MKISSHIALLIALCGSLSGCASVTPVSKPAASESTASDKDAPAAAEESAAPVIADPLPAVALTDEILFKIVSAEIAFQRGDWSSAYATMISVAQQTKDPRLAKRALEMALISKQSSQAYLASRLWREYAPHSDEAAQYYLGFMIINNNFSEINTIVSQRLALATPKERGIIMLQTQRMLMRSSDQTGAFALLQEMYGPYKDYVEAHLALAQAAHARKNSTRALSEAQVALTLKPDSQLAALTLAQVSPSAEQASEALADFLKKNPAAREVRQAYANMLIEQKQFAQARHQFELLLTETPRDPGTLYTLGILSLQMNELDTGEKYLKAFLDAEETSASDVRDPTSALMYLSQIADDRKDGQTALDWLGKIPSFDGKNTAYFNVQMRRAQLYAKYEGTETAINFLHEMHVNPTEHIQVIQMEAELLREANRHTDAFSVLQAGITTHPDNTELLYDYAMIAEKLDKLTEMETALRTVIKLTPENQHAYNALGYSWADRNIRLPEARDLIKKALELSPNDPFILDSMGWLEFRVNNTNEAINYLQRAYDIRPDVEIAAHLGEVWWVIGEQEKAKKIWHDAMKKEADNELLKSTMMRFNVSD